ncbi:low temperature requirement protein A [Amycolatopsis cihanbeyliensis]|uniref:Low temperature requirement protein LtrA n=1 Tax=Amycolatopsis cihanbeyliensis TaxID=1128664 RepID=A0A542DQD2_AMYCI|nr:low temperature requirement protein A [Amycolatopsis cihanbeyliensis]TQJ05302.1 low temperature requirement protein LtrA [Amycolatopsis cihanbeyliensis]
MHSRSPVSTVLRDRKSGKAPEVGAIELFFDLVYVFAVIQLSHFLAAHLSGIGALQVAILFLAVWWGWNYTAWAMNWLNPDNVLVRILLAVLMLASLGMSVSLPAAFDDEALLFAGSYLCLQLVRSAFMVWACRGLRLGANYARLLAYSALAGVCWLLGGFLPDHQLWLWALAVVIDYAAPMVNFTIPGFGSAPMSTWPLHREHLAERNRLVFIIALGESILIMGFTLTDLELTAPVVTATLIGFVGLVLLWWNYFAVPSGGEREEDPEGEQQTAIARSAFAYAHGIMIAGAIVVAVSIEQITMHPTGHLDAAVIGCVTGGPVLYLLGNLLYSYARSGALAWSRVVVIGLLVALAVLAGTTHLLTPLALAGLATLCMLGLAVFATRAEAGQGQG